MDLSQTNIDSFHEHGYLILKSPFWSELKTQIEADLKEFILKVIGKHPSFCNQLKELEGRDFHSIVTYCAERETQEASVTSAIYDLFPKRPCLFSLITNNKILEVLNKLGVQEPMPSTIPIMRMDSTQKSQYLTPWHQDIWYSFVSPNSVTIWFPLFNLTHDMGLLQVLPGTHKNGICRFKPYDGYEPFVAEVEKDTEKDMIEVPIARDEILIFYQSLLHKSGRNTSNTPRLSVQLRFNDFATQTALRTSFRPVQSAYVKNQQDLYLEKWGHNNETV